MRRKENVIEPTEEKVVKTEKSLENMTDAEFVMNVDKMSEPDRIARLSDVCNDPVAIENFLRDYDLSVLKKDVPFTITTPKNDVSDTQTGVVSENKTQKVEEPKGKEEGKKEKKKEGRGGEYVYKKRHFLLVLTALFSLACLAAIVIGAVGIKYASTVQTGEKTYGLLDPVFSAVNSFLTEPFVPSAFNVVYRNARSWQSMFILYALAVASVLFAVCMVVTFIKSMFALFDRGENGLYKKRSFLLWGLAALVCSLIIILGTAYALGEPVLDFVTMKGEAKIGYVLYGAFGASVLVTLFGGLSYGKNK